MVLHGETERETVLYNKQFHKLLHDVSYGRTHSANSQPFGDRDAEKKRKGEREVEDNKGVFVHDPAICLGEEAICANVYRWTDGRRSPHDGIAHSV